MNKTPPLAPSETLPFAEQVVLMEVCADAELPGWNRVVSATTARIVIPSVV